jgi:hypothetical protein
MRVTVELDDDTTKAPEPGDDNGMSTYPVVAFGLDVPCSGPGAGALFQVIVASVQLTPTWFAVSAGTFDVVAYSRSRTLVTVPEIWPRLNFRYIRFVGAPDRAQLRHTIADVAEPYWLFGLPEFTPASAIGVMAVVAAAAGVAVAKVSSEATTAVIAMRPRVLI